MKPATLAILLVLAAAPAFAERVTVPLNGPWQIGDTVAAEPAPRAFPSTVAVPGLVHNATPAFADVDAFDSLELVNNKISQKLLPETARVSAARRLTPEAELLLVPTHVRGPRAEGHGHPARPQGAVRDGGVAQRDEDR